MHILTDAQKFGIEVAQQTENELMRQLNNLIGKGLIVIVEEQPKQFVQDYSAGMKQTGIKIVSKIRLELKDQEYIKKLEDERDYLKEKIGKIKSSLNGII